MKLKRVFFAALYYGFAIHLPPSSRPGSFGARRIRFAICRHLFASCGRNVNIEHGADFESGGKLSIGDNSGIGIHARISGPVEIGRDVMMGPYVQIYAVDHRGSRMDAPVREQGMKSAEAVHIADDVSIGAGSIILAGVRIGRGAVIGAGSVLRHDVPEYAVVIGNPAEIAGYRPGWPRATPAPTGGPSRTESWNRSAPKGILESVPSSQEVKHRAVGAENLVRELLAQKTSLPLEAIEWDLRLHEDLGLDSVDAVEIVTWLERETGQQFDLTDPDAVETVGDLVNCLIELPGADMSQRRPNQNQ
jgi:maltose O-acetyltransferase